MRNFKKIFSKTNLIWSIAIPSIVYFIYSSIKYFLQLKNYLELKGLRGLYLNNALIIIFLVLSFFIFRKLFSTRAFRETFQRVMKQRRARYSMYIVLFYFFIGILDLIHKPYTIQVQKSGQENILRSKTLLDYLFEDVFQVKDESTYSSPLSSTVDYSQKKEAVKSTHLLGTDIIGKDVLYLTMKGCSTAFLLAFGTSLIVFPIAILLGISAGFFGGWIDDIIIWLYTTISSMPFLLFVIALIMIMGRSLEVIIIALGLTSWVGTCRLLRGETIKHKSLEYIEAAKTQGAGNFRILFKHLLPNIMHLIIIQFSLLSSNFIFAESIFSFLGIGLDAGSGSWGAMISNAQSELIRQPSIWWPFISAGFIGIFPIVLGLNIFGDSLRDALDPKLRQEWN